MKRSHEKQKRPSGGAVVGAGWLLALCVLCLMLSLDATVAQEQTVGDPAQTNQQDAETGDQPGQDTSGEQRERPVQPDPGERADALRQAGAAEEPTRRVPRTRASGSRNVTPDTGGEPEPTQEGQQPQGDAEATAQDEAAPAATAEQTTADDVQPEMGQGVEEDSAQPRLTPEERGRALRQTGAVNRRMPTRRNPARGVNPARVQEEMNAASGEDTQGKIEMMREHLDQYYENQRLISKEWTDWQLTEQMLTARINHMKQQIESVREDTAKLEGEITDVDREKNELAEKNQRLGELQEYQRRQIEKLERKARTLAGYLPPSLASKLNPLIERLPPADADPEEIEVSVAQRYPTVLGIFSQIEKFNRAIQLEMDTYELETGDEVQVEVLYLGLGQGYMVQVGQEQGGLAGVGNPSADGWVWERRDDLADEIRKVIRIFEGDGTAEFVGLPATIK